MLWKKWPIGQKSNVSTTVTYNHSIVSHFMLVLPTSTEIYEYQGKASFYVMVFSEVPNMLKERPFALRKVQIIVHTPSTI